MQMGCYLIFIILGISACVSGQKGSSAHEDHSDSLTQGIQGKVLWLEGNQMPTFVEDTAVASESPGKPVSRTVHIYRLTHRDQATMENGFYTSVNSTLVKKVNTGEDGYFQTFLPSGRYSLFVEEPQGLYANLYDGEGHIQPVTVEKDSVRQITLKVDYKAVY